MRLKVLTLALAVLTTVLAPAAGAEKQIVGTALGHDGQLVSLLSGTYGEIFPGGTETEADITVLALRRTLPDGQQLLEVVPATLDQDTEEDAELVVEPVSGVSYVFWQSWTNLIHCRLLVSSFDGQSWAEPIQVSGSAFAWRDSPAFAVTRDSFVDFSSPDKAQVTRTVLHILWSEEGDEGYWETRYAPLVLENGEYIGEHPVLVLNDLFATEGGAVASAHRMAPVIRSREDGNSIVAAFLDQGSGQVAAVELRFAAGELSILGDAVADEIEQVASQTEIATRAGVDRLVAAVQARLLGYEEHVKQEILAPLAANIERHLRGRLGDGSPGDVASIRDDARAQLIDVGLHLTDGRVRRVTSVARAQLIDVGARGDSPQGRHRHDARSSVASSRSLPNIPATPEILVSNKGTKLMLVWFSETRVSYQESKDDGGWSGAQHIQLTSQLDRSKAFAVLQQRLDQ